MINGFNIQALIQQSLQQAGINLNALSGTNNTGNVNFLNGTNSTQQTQTATNDGKTPEEIQAEIDKLEQDKLDNNAKIEQAKEKIKNLVSQIQTDLHESKELKEKEIDKHEDQVDKMIEEQIEEYNKANREDGDGMTKQELEKNIASSMPKEPDLSKAIAKQLTANKKLDEIEKLNIQMDKLEIENKTIDEDIKLKTDAKAQAQQAQQQAQQQQVGVNGVNGAVAGGTDGEADWWNTADGAAQREKMGWTTGSYDEWTASQYSSYEEVLSEAQSSASAMGSSDDSSSSGVSEAVTTEESSL